MIFTAFVLRRQSTAHAAEKLATEEFHHAKEIGLRNVAAPEALSRSTNKIRGPFPSITVKSRRHFGERISFA